jgi:glycerol kinase
MEGMTRFLLALDQGTTSSRALIVDETGRVLTQAQKEFPQIYPQPGWVEQDPEAIWQSQLETAREALARAGLAGTDLTAIGITNQRETTLLWDADTGAPLYNAIVWQCRRTAALCDRLKREGWEDTVRAKTGLPIDAYFSGSKIRWLLDQVPGARQRAEQGKLRFGTVDSFLLWRLTGGQAHATDWSNASRTMLFNLQSLDWDPELLDLLRIPRQILPALQPSCGWFGSTDPQWFGAQIPITAIAGDQQAALFGQACFAPGMVKNTYGTGCFLLLNTGTQRIFSRQGLLTTVAWGLPEGVTYALEGSVFVAGAAVQWLRDGLGILSSSDQIQQLASQVPDTGGVVFVPAFVGLGAPTWDMYARGLLIGLTRGTNRAHIARACEEAIGFQTKDVLEAMRAEAGLPIGELRVDGGGTRDSFLMQWQSDILNLPVVRGTVGETTALGAAYLAGLATGVWQDLNQIAALWQAAETFRPRMAQEERSQRYRQWRRALERSLQWAS